MPQSQAALTFALNGGRHPRVPHSPPWWYQSTYPLRRKRPYTASTRLIRALHCVTISLLSRACLYSPLQGGPAFLLPAPGRMRFPMHRQSPLRSDVRKVRKSTIIPLGCIMAPPEVGPPGRGRTELRNNGVLRSSHSSTPSPTYVRGQDGLFSSIIYSSSTLPH